MDLTPTVKPPWWFGIIKPALTGFLRHGLTSAATLLAGWGVIQSDQTTQFVSIAFSILVWFAGYAWSNYSGAVKKADLVQSQAQTSALAEQNRQIVAATQRATGTDVPL